MPGTTWNQLERRSRIERRQHLRNMGRKPARMKYVYRVETTAIAIPDWILDQAVPDLSFTRDYVWLKSEPMAKYLCQLDRNEGGQPNLTAIEARRCKVCGMLRLNLLAEQRRKLDESAVDGRKLPCSPECLVRQRQRKGLI